MPAFENYRLRQITVGKVDQFIKTLASTKSYSTAKQARTVLSLVLGLAVRYGALRENPVRDIASRGRDGRHRPSRSQRACVRAPPPSATIRFRRVRGRRTRAASR